MKLVAFPIVLTALTAIYLFFIFSHPYSTGAVAASSEAARPAAVLFASNGTTMPNAAHRSVQLAASPTAPTGVQQSSALYQVLLIALVFSAAGAAVNTAHNKRTRSRRPA